jgi:hypothetical protein
LLAEDIVGFFSKIKTIPDSIITQDTE